MMKNSSNMDFLTLRRKKDKIDLPLLKSNKKFIRAGLLIGGSLLSFVLFLSLVFSIQLVLNKIKRSKLKPYVTEHDAYVMKINDLKNKIKKLKNTNIELSQAITSIRSGSSILSEIGQLIPASISLTNLTLQGNNLEIKGVVNQKKGLELINIFILELTNSDFLVNESVKLLNANNMPTDEKNKAARTLFQVNAKIIDDPSIINKNYLKELGSYGLYKRIDLINSKTYQ